ncbi:MAG TPA: carboxypeptidase regulatory-like domain-containing protein [Terracidiphilus sp.]|jgi:hypothetical protein
MKFIRLQSAVSILTPTRFFWRSVVIVSTIVVACLFAYAANVNGRIRGTVTDPQNAVVAGAHITATNVATGIKHETVSGADGGYLFPELPIGNYSVSAKHEGFKTFTATGIVLNIDQEYVQPIKLVLGSVSTVVEVSASSVQVDTTDMEFSNIVDSTQMVELPLIGRNFTGLELTLPGVQSLTGSERVGGYSVSGAQEQQSEFMINGADNNDIALNTQLLTPILDAVGEFNLITGPLNAEYDRNSGGIVSASIKSGTKTYHGDVFEYYRDTFLNTNNFFQKSASGSPTAVSPFHQNIVGGTIGGPVAPFMKSLKNKLFVFGAFQAQPSRVPQGAGSATVYTSDNLNNGDFSTDNPAVVGSRPSNIVDPHTGFAPPWGNFIGAPIPSTITVTGCTSAGETWAQCAYDLGGVFPTHAFNSVTKALVDAYVPPPNSGTNGYVFNETTTTTAYQEDGRLDFNPNARNQFSFVGIYNFSNVANTIPFSGASLPGFGDGTIQHTQQYSFDYVRQISTTAVNDFGIHWTRFNDKAAFPQQTALPSSVGFSISPQDPASATVPQLGVSGFFTLGGTNNGPQPRIDQNYQIEDNFSKVLGRHALKFGFDGRKFSVWNIFDASNSGAYSFNNSASPYTTGDPSLDLLLGIPGSYTQGTGSIIQADALLTYFYGQDTWKFTKDITINYGMGYSIDTPLRNHQYKGEGLACFILGETSNIFPNSPQDMVFPGDPGCKNSGQATTRHTEVGPRLGFSWAPDLGKISGGPGKFSIRGGFGIYYDRTEEETALQTLGTPPFGFTSGGAGDFGGTPSLVNPYADINGGLTTPGHVASESNPFPYVQPAVGAPVSFAAEEPIHYISGFGPSFRAPYAENYQLSIERELPSKMVTRISYVGSQARHNQTAYEANYETAAGHAACLANPTCSLTGERNYQAVYFPENKLADSTTVASMGMVGSGANSIYSGLQVSVTKGETHGLLFQLSYTWAHAIDSGSSFENTGFGNAGERGYNQYVTSLNKGDSTFDARQRIVFSPVYVVPFKHGSSAFSPYNLALSGWQISGIMTFATGFPYDISYNGGTSKSLWCDAVTGFYVCPDSPNQIAPLVRLNPRLRNGSGFGPWFDGTIGDSFVNETIGSFGTTARNPYHGPGINNTNAIIAKNFSLGANRSRYLQIRMESDNVFNHTQFGNPSGNYTSGLFGQITGAANARQTQLATKVVF